MRIFACHNILEKPLTGGEIFYAEILNYLRGREDIELLLPSEVDRYFLNRPNGCLGINLYFLKRFRQLPFGTVIVENESHYYDFFIVNSLIKLLRPDLRVLTQVCQVPDSLFQGWKAKLVARIMMFGFLHAADRVVVLSRSLKEQMVRLGAIRKQTDVVYISGQRLDGLNAHRSERPQDAPVRIACVAHIRPRKGQKTLIEALHLLSGTRFEAILVGATKDQDYEDDVRRLIITYGLEERITLTGLLQGSELAQAYAESDILVLPSSHEPYGIVVQEAMSFGLPIVASNVDGIPEQVTNGIEGLLVPPSEPVSLAKAIGRLIENAHLRLEMGQQARRRSTELPTWHEVCELYQQSIMKVGRPRAGGLR